MKNKVLISLFVIGTLLNFALWLPSRTRSFLYCNVEGLTYLATHPRTYHAIEAPYVPGKSDGERWAWLGKNLPTLPN